MTDRGQLLLAGAFVLAVALIGLTLVFSAGDYTTVLASEESGISQGTDAITARESVRADLESALQVVHTEYDPPRSNFETAFEELLPQLATETRHYYAGQGRLVNVSGPTFVQGERIKQGSDALFVQPDTRTDSPPTGNWDVALGTTARNATFVFSDVPIYSGQHFTVLFGDWAVKVYEGSSGSSWKVTVKDTTSSFEATCTRSGTGSEMTVDLSQATVDGDHCHALTTLEPGNGYDVRFENGDEAEGRFWFTVTDGAPTIPTDQSSYNDREEAIYAVQVDYRYRSSTVDYETPLRIAPGEIE